MQFGKMGAEEEGWKTWCEPSESMVMSNEIAKPQQELRVQRQMTRA